MNARNTQLYTEKVTLEESEDAREKAQADGAQWPQLGAKPDTAAGDQTLRDYLL